MTIILHNLDFLLTSRRERILINAWLALGEFGWKHNLPLHFLRITALSKFSMSTSNLCPYFSQATENFTVWKLCFCSFRLDWRYEVSKPKSNIHPSAQTTRDVINWHLELHMRSPSKVFTLLGVKEPDTQMWDNTEAVSRKPFYPLDLAAEHWIPKVFFS